MKIIIAHDLYKHWENLKLMRGDIDSIQNAIAFILLCTALAILIPSFYRVTPNVRLEINLEFHHGYR